MTCFKWALAGALVLSAFFSLPAYAESPATPVAVAQGLAELEKVTAACVSADAAFTTKYQPILSYQVPLNLSMGDVVTSLRKAREDCQNGAPDRSLMVYIRLTDAMNNALKLAGRQTR